MSADYTIRNKRWASRLSLKSNAPRSACERCYTDITESEVVHGHLLWFRCPNCHHNQTRTRQAGLAHAEYCNRSTWQEANR